jgi:hypothetical protein
LEALQDLDVGCGSRAPQLDTISLDRLEDGMYRSSLLLSESCEFCPSNQQLGESNSEKFPFGEDVMLPVSFLSRCSPRYLTWSSQGSCTLFIWTGEHVPLRVVNVTWTDLRTLACIRHFWSQSWIARRLVWSFWEATAGSLSVARTAVSSANVAVVVVGELGRSKNCWKRRLFAVRVM